MTGTLTERLLAKVSPEPMSGCWLWLGSDTGTSGYGVVWGGTRMLLAHRASYEIHVGPIPDGLELDHRCRVHCCVNPRHLEPVTRRENVIRGVSPNAKNAAKTHCKRGHAFTRENTGSHPSRPRHRFCIICNREHARAQRQR